MPEEKSGFDDWYERRAQLPSVKKYRQEGIYRMAFLIGVGLPLIGICSWLQLPKTTFWIVFGIGITVANGLGMYLARRRWAKAEKSN